MVLFPWHSFRMRKTTRKGAIILALASASCLAYWLHPMQPDYSVDAMFSYIKFDPDPSHAARKVPGTGTYMRGCSVRTWHGASARWITSNATLLGISSDGASHYYPTALQAPIGDYAHEIDINISNSYNVYKIDKKFLNHQNYQESASYTIPAHESQPYRDAVSVANMYKSIQKVLGEPTVAKHVECGNGIDLNYSRYSFPFCAFSSGYSVKVRYGYYSVSKSGSCL